MPPMLEGEERETVDSVAPSWAAGLKATLDELLHGELTEQSQVGLMIYDLTADSVVYSYGARQSLRPASVEKVLTAVVALKELGGNYPLRTTLSYTGTVSDGVLWGDLWLRGEMDPLFDSTDLRVFADSLRLLGIDSIAGQLLLDRSMKDTLRLGEGWSWDDFDSNPPLSPLLYCGREGLEQAVSRTLQELGISAPSAWMESVMPAEAVALCERSHSIDQLLIRMMKKSDNLHAEAVFYQLGKQAGRYPKASQSAARVERFVEQQGFSKSAFRVADGCGLSLYNYTTAEIIVAALRYAYCDESLHRHLRPTLPVAGLDGTLEKRLRGTAAFGNVRAKTGTVNRVSTLAGYATSGEGHDIAFCIINQGLRSAAAAREMQDRVCIAICQ